MRSKPSGEMQENTTEYLVKDIEKLRKHLNISNWIIFGGSRRSTLALALAYGEAYPERCLGFILRGIFLGTQEENDNFWKGAERTFPKAWAKLNEFLPMKERKNILKAYYKRSFSQDLDISEPAMNALNIYDLTLGFSYVSSKNLDEYMLDSKPKISFTRAFVHYSYNNFFLGDNELLDNLYKIKHLPAIIIQGRYDTLCPLKNAYKLFVKWPNSQLIIISNAGHASSESGTTKALVEATNKFKELSLCLQKF